MTHIFIVNPSAGKEIFADELRKELEKIPELSYFIFTTRYAGYEKKLVRQLCDLFSDEPLRFYSCGGSGTMRNIMNAIDDLDRVELTVYPCGLSNDFMSVFGKDRERFLNLEELVNGDVVDVDYIRSDHGICLNTMSAGVDARVYRHMKKYRDLHLIGKKLPYSLAIVDSIFVTDPNELIITLDGEQIEGRFSEVIFANGFVIGGGIYVDSSADVQDGVGSYLLVPPQMGLSLLRQLSFLRKKKFSKIHQNVPRGTWRRLHIETADKRPLMMNQDGELLAGYTEWNAEIVQQGLHFVVPKGVRP